MTVADLKDLIKDWPDDQRVYMRCEDGTMENYELETDSVHLFGKVSGYYYIPNIGFQFIEGKDK